MMGRCVFAMTLALLAWCPDAHALDPVVGATHHGDVTAAGVRWTSIYEWEHTQVHHGSIRLAHPLPATTQVIEASVPVELRRDDAGRVLGLEVEVSGGRAARVDLLTSTGSPVRAPLAAALVAQRVELDGVEYGALVDGPMERRVLESRHRAIGEGALLRARKLHKRVPHGRLSLYVLPDQAFLEAGGVDALVTTRAARRSLPMLACLLVLTVVGCGVASRALRRSADAEEVDHFLSSM